MDERTRQEVAAIFTELGVDDGVSVVHPMSADEAIFVIRPTVAARVPEASVTRALQQVLRRKVWVTTDGPAWAGQTEPFQLR